MPRTPMLFWRRGMRWSKSLMLLVAAVILSGAAPLALAQPPGTFPPKEIIRPSGGATESGQLPIEGILFLDEAKVPVYVPPLSYEDYLELERGKKSQTRRYLFESVKIDGRVEGQRAELTVEVRIAVDATGDETVDIPLAMENFHLLGAPEFFAGREGNNKLAVSVDEETGSRELVATIEEDTVVGFRMQMSARVESDPVHSLDFRLPPAPIVVNLLSDSIDVIGQIPDRDDEVIETAKDPTGRARFKIESSGGRFTLQWGKLSRADTTPLLESTSTVSLQWNSPQDQLIQDVRMTIRDARAPISGFRLRIPPNATLRADPKLITSGQFGQLVELSQPDPADKELYLIAIPTSEQEKTIALEFRLEIPSDTPSAEKPLPFQVAVVDGAMRNQGVVNIAAGRDYRLRWRQRPYIKNIATDPAEEASSDQRNYSFQFIRGSFTLPVWLDATKSELRVSSECDIELRDNYANLSMEIRSVGDANRSQLLSVDLADWQSPRIEDARTGAPLPWYESGDVIEIEVSYTGMEESIPVLIKTRRMISDGPSIDQAQRVDLPIPRVVGSGDRRDPVTIQDAFVRLSGKGRRSLVVDLEQSSNLQRADETELGALLDRGSLSEREYLDPTGSDETSRIFVVVPPESPASLVGVITLQQPRISLQHQSSVKLAGDQIVTTVNWDLESSVDLEGKLRIAIPVSSVADAEASANPEGESRDGGDESAASPGRETIDSVNDWTVTVNDAAARLERVAETTTQPSADGSVESRPVQPGAAEDVSNTGSTTEKMIVYDLVSDALGNGSMNVRFVRSDLVAYEEESLESQMAIGLPIPAVRDVTLQGSAEIEFLGDETSDITPSEKSLTDQLAFRTLPTQQIPIRISPRMPSENELLSGKMIVRSAVSEVSQHDQLLVNLTGTGEFVLRLMYPEQTDIQVTLNGAPADYKIVDNQLVVRIPSDVPSHLIDIRLWVDRTGRDLFQAVQPLASIGPGSGQMYWQLTVPADCHLVWAAPSVGREMTWRFDQWRLIRRPLLNETALIDRIGTSEPETIDLSPMPKGNRYLFASTDDRAFQAMASSRTMLWIIVAGTMVFIAAILTYIPATRNPFSMVVAIAGFSGLLVAAPDAAVLVGQVSMLAIILVLVMLAIRSLVLPTPSRVLKTSPEGRPKSSINSRRKQAEYRPPSSIAVTHSIGPEDVASTPDEVAS